MALASRKLSKKLLKDRTGTGEIDANRITRASSSFANDTFTEDPNVVDSLGPILYHTDLMSEDIDELRRHITEDRTVTDNNFTTAEKSKLAGIETGADVTDTTNVVNALTAGTNITIAANGTISSTASGGGGGLTDTPLIATSGRGLWSSADSGEAIHIGSISYGFTSYYSHASEPSNTTLKTYDNRAVVDTTSITNGISNYMFMGYGFYVPDESKKVKMVATYRIQNAPASSTWGWSLWNADYPGDGTTSSTITLRARSSDITYGNSSVYTHQTILTTRSTMSDTHIFPLIENRSGTLTTNTYVYFTAQFFLTA